MPILLSSFTSTTPLPKLNTLETDCFSPLSSVSPPRRASEREALLEAELAGCTFAPELPTRRRGRSGRQSVGADTGRSYSARSPGSSEKDVVEQEDRRVDDAVGSFRRPKRRHGGAGHHKPIVVSSGQWLSSPPAEVVGEEEQQEYDIEDDGSDSSVDAGGDGGSSSRVEGRWAGGGRRSSVLVGIRGREEGDDDSILLDDDDFRAENGQVFQPVGDGSRDGTATMSRAGSVATVGSSLPDGWTAFSSPEGWDYFFHNETRVVQWKRPTR